MGATVKIVLMALMIAGLVLIVLVAAVYGVMFYRALRAKDELPGLEQLPDDESRILSSQAAPPGISSVRSVFRHVADTASPCNSNPS